MSTTHYGKMLLRGDGVFNGISIFKSILKTMTVKPFLIKRFLQTRENELQTSGTSLTKFLLDFLVQLLLRLIKSLKHNKSFVGL